MNVRTEKNLVVDFVDENLTWAHLSWVEQKYQKIKEFTQFKEVVVANQNSENLDERQNQARFFLERS